VVIGPKDLPVIIRHVAKFLRRLREFYDGVRTSAMKLADEAGLSELRQEVTTIIDLDGKPQVAYDVKELEQLASKSKVEVPKVDV
jgi:Sec-independent protein translocase protein TatA